MTNMQKGVLAMIGACLIWGLSPIYYKLLVHIPASSVLAHRTLWSLVFFAGVLALQGRLGEMREALFSGWRQAGLIAVATMMISVNWFLFIYATQIGRNTETSLGYYIYPLVAVLIGRVGFGERLSRAQGLAVGLAAMGVLVLGAGVGVVPWISLTLAVTFGLYGVIKKLLPLGPVVSVTCEVAMFLPVSLIILGAAWADGQGVFGDNARDNALLLASGPITALPLILFSVAARRIPMSTVGVLQYINPTMQFLSAVLLFAEPFTGWHAVAFPLIWLALVIFSVSILRQDRATRRAAMAFAGVSTTVRNPASEASAKP
jgi:chloramphenicol-sensitive protein RarD